MSKKKEYVFPQYDKFTCLMGSCPVNCCHFEAGGYITDDKIKRICALKNVITAEGLPFDPARDIIQTKYGKKFRISDQTGYCIFLTKEDICKLQVDFGRDNCPEGCAYFPRINNIFCGRVEKSLEFGCPGSVECFKKWDAWPFLLSVEDDEPLPVKMRRDMILALKDTSRSFYEIFTDFCYTYECDIQIKELDEGHLTIELRDFLHMIIAIGIYEWFPLFGQHRIKQFFQSAIDIISEILHFPRLSMETVAEAVGLAVQNYDNVEFAENIVANEIIFKL